jgi:hypothetical protein
VLTPADETLAHQIADTFDHVHTSDHRFFDRDWFSANHPEGDVALITGLAAYANMNVVDGFVAVQHGGRQYNVRVSRRLRPVGPEMRVGPLRHEVVVPLTEMRLVLDAGDEHPLGCDLRWTGILPAHEEPHHFLRVDGRAVRDYRRYDQAGEVSGWISIEGARHDVDRWWGARDHSWGVRNGVGGWEPPSATKGFPGIGPGETGMFLWLEFATATLGGHVQYVESDGRRVEPLHGFVWDRPEGTRRAEVVVAEAEVDRHPGTDAYRSVRLRLDTDDGRRYDIDATPLHTAWAYRGTGYNRGFADGGGLGVPRGKFHLEHDVYDVSDPETVRLLPSGEITAAGHREQPARLSVNGEPGFGHFPIMYLRSPAT